MDSPCQRLVLTWQVEESVLRQIVSAPLIPVIADGHGDLKLAVVHCGEQGVVGNTPSDIAFLTIPIAANSVPIPFSGATDDSWSYLAGVMVPVDTSAADLFSQHGFLVVGAQLATRFERTDGNRIVSGSITFDQGRVEFEARLADSGVDESGFAAAVRYGPHKYSTMFGRESFRRVVAVEVEVEISGTSILSDLGLSPNADSAVFDAKMVFEDHLWSQELASD